MDIRGAFSFLEEKYGLTYQFQEFKDYYHAGYNVYAHSYYNDSGCFTVYLLPVRDEMEFYVSSKFSTELKDLMAKCVPESSIEPQVWDKHINRNLFSKRFFWWSKKRIIAVAAEAISVHLTKHDEFFGIKVQTTKQ